MRSPLVICVPLLLASLHCSDEGAPGPNTAPIPPASTPSSAAAAPAAPSGPNGKVVAALEEPTQSVAAKVEKDDAAVDVALKVPVSFVPGPPEDGHTWQIAGADDGHGARAEVWLVEAEDYDAELARVKGAEGTSVKKAERTADGFVIVAETRSVVSVIARKKVGERQLVHCATQWFFEDVGPWAPEAAKWAEGVCASVTAKPQG